MPREIIQPEGIFSPRGKYPYEQVCKHGKHIYVAGQLAFDIDGNLYSAASYMGRKGVVRITPDRKTDLFVSGPGIVGLAFSPTRSMIVATTNAIFRVDVGVRGSR